MTPSVKILKKEILSANWYKLYKYTFTFIDRQGQELTQSREAYDRGNGATILLYNKEQRTVILTRQFRLPTFVNGNADGMLVEACAGCWTLITPKTASAGKPKKRPAIASRTYKRFLKYICHQVPLRKYYTSS